MKRLLLVLGTGSLAQLPAATGDRARDAFFVGQAAASAEEAELPEGWRELPEGWRELPDLVLQQPGAARRGFGDPASGCFALVQRASGQGVNPDTARAALASGLKTRGLEVAGTGEEVAVRGLGVEGRIRTAMQSGAGGSVAAVSTACFHNARHPERCKAQCDALLDSTGGGR